MFELDRIVRWPAAEFNGVVCIQSIPNSVFTPNEQMFVQVFNKFALIYYINTRLMNIMI